MPFLVDNFTDANGTVLTDHTPDLGGAWTALDFSAGGGTPNLTATIQSNRLAGPITNTFPGSPWYRNAADSGSAEYDVSVEAEFGAFASNRYLQIAFRMTPTGTAYADVDFYEVILNNTTSAGVVTLNKVVAGVSTQLATAAYALGSLTHQIRIECRDATKKVFIDDVEILSSEDNVITQAGRIGLQTRRSAAGGVDSFDSLSAGNDTVPGAPTIGTATAGVGSASVSFSAPGSNGGSAITGYRVTSTPGSITATGATSPINVTGLTVGVGYTFTVAAQNASGWGPESDASNAVTPTEPPAVPPTANAGPDQTVIPGQLVTLTAAGSTTTGSVTYAWAQTAGTTAILRDATTSTPDFHAPLGPGVSTFEVTVTDDGGTDTDTVAITLVDAAGGLPVSVRINGAWI